MSNPVDASRIHSFVTGLALCAAAAGAAALARSAPARELFVEGPLARCADHADGPPEFNRRRLEREFDQLATQLQIGTLALAAAALLHAALAQRIRVRVPLLAAVTCGGGLLACAAVAAMQAPIALAAIERGLLTMSREERFASLYPEASRAAAIVAREVQDDARVLVVDFADPDHVHVFGYLAFPRRVYTPTDPNLRFSASTFRELLARDPTVLEECRARGYAAAVDLRRLVAGDESGLVIVPPIGTRKNP